MESNLNLHYFELLQATQTLPMFRHRALEEKFAENLTAVCWILTGYGNLKQYYDIMRMLNLMKLENWQKIEPFRYYLQPLKETYTVMREELLWLNSKGPLFVRFPLKMNFQLEKKLIATIERDVIVQRLIETPIKQDQFKFLYETVQVIYKSAL